MLILRTSSSGDDGITDSVFALKRIYPKRRMILWGQNEEFDVMFSFFLWDGKSYGDSFITSRKINANILACINEGSVLEIHTYSVLKQSPPLIFLRSFEVVETVTYIINTPLSLETLPKPITLIGFESYLSTVSLLLDPPVPSLRKRESPSSTSDSLSLSYEDKRM